MALEGFSMKIDMGVLIPSFAFLPGKVEVEEVGLLNFCRFMERECGRRQDIH